MTATPPGSTPTVGGTTTVAMPGSTVLGTTQTAPVAGQSAPVQVEGLQLSRSALPSVQPTTAVLGTTLSRSGVSAATLPRTGGELAEELAIAAMFLTVGGFTLRSTRRRRAPKH